MTKVVFLDRDGTINVDHGYVHTVQGWEFCKGAPEGLKLLQDAGYTLAIVTNQSGIAHGLYTEGSMLALHEYMKEELAKAGVTISAVGFCPHGRDQKDCDCRKPKSGMAKQIEKVIGPIEYAASWTIGDKEADWGFGKAAGTKTALIRSQYWQEAKLKEKPDLIVDSLFDFAEHITNS
jgi:D-glycero-D-manno-heptose 1,7-bisphosphate phosphatase